MTMTDNQRQPMTTDDNNDNKDGNGATGDKVDNDGDNDDFGDGRRQQLRDGRRHDGIQG